MISYADSGSKLIFAFLIQNELYKNRKKKWAIIIWQEFFRILGEIDRAFLKWKRESLLGRFVSPQLPTIDLREFLLGKVRGTFWILMLWIDEFFGKKWGSWIFEWWDKLTGNNKWVHWVSFKMNLNIYSSKEKYDCGLSNLQEKMKYLRLREFSVKLIKILRLQQKKFTPLLARLFLL